MEKLLSIGLIVLGGLILQTGTFMGFVNQDNIVEVDCYDRDNNKIQGLTCEEPLFQEITDLYMFGGFMMVLLGIAFTIIGSIDG